MCENFYGKKLFIYNYMNNKRKGKGTVGVSGGIRWHSPNYLTWTLYAWKYAKIWGEMREMAAEN